MKNLFLIALFLGLSQFIFIPQSQSQTTRYVKAGASGSGTGNWANASGDLQAMINASAANDIIWVAGGVYKPNTRADNQTSEDLDNDRNNAFVLRKDVKIYGGFAGTENLLTQRDLTLTANASILSGDLGTVNTKSDNAYHVVISIGDAGTAELNGFTIKDGNADGSGNIPVNSVSIFRNCGAGIHNSSSSLVLTNVTISGNNAYYGGGIYNSSSSPVLTNVNISGNNANYGGGIYNSSSSSPVLTNVSISGNNAANVGGGIYNLSSSSPVLTNVTISGNKANEGGGIYNQSVSSPLLTNVTISGNSATSDGGGIFNYGSDTKPKIRNSIIYGNTSGIRNASNAVIEYSLVQSLTATTNGNITGATDPLFVSPLAPGLNAGGDYRLQPGSPVINKGNNVYFNTGQTPDLSAITTDRDGNPRKKDAIDMGAYEYSFLPDANGILYVKKGANGNGSAWTNALGEVGDALKTASDLNAAKPGTVVQIWVAGGIYKPQYRIDNMSNADPNGRYNAFLLVKDVKIYGGFAGIESSLADRDLTQTANASILSGDLGTVGVNTDNACHVVVGAGNVGTAELNGFTINDANANVFTNFTVNSVSIPLYSGAGIYNESSSPVLTNLIISGNNAASSGGGIYNSNSSSPVLTNVTISGNSTKSNGGGISNSNSSSPVLDNVTISVNSAGSSGGGIYNNGTCSPVLSNVTISGNSAAAYGGGIYNQSSSSPVLTNVSISGNSAATGGGIYSNQASSPALTNVTISGNTASSDGGGIYNSSNCSPVLTNVTISGNTASTNGGGIYNNNASNPQIRNSIIYGNNSGIYNTTVSSKPVIAYSLVQGLSVISDGNIDGATDPLFVSPLAPGLNTGGDYRLQSGSPLINKGNDAYFSTGQTPDLSAITIDLDSNIRIQKGKIDIGAYESPYETISVITPDANGVVYVTTTGAGNQSGDSWGNAANDIQKGINTTGAQQVWVAGGVYKPKYRADNMSDADANDRDNAFVLKKDVKVYGGFAGTETSLTQRNLTLTANASILSGDLGVAINNSDNAYHIVISTGDAGTAEWNGFTVKDGNANGSGKITVNSVLIQEDSGGGMYNESSSPALANVSISGNNAKDEGGGMYNKSSSPVLTNVSISGNNADDGGGGMYNESSSPVLTNVTISGNYTDDDGGAMFNKNSSPQIRNSIIYGNNRGVYNSSSTPVIEYSLVQNMSGTANGNINGATNPLFVSPVASGLNTGGDYRLQSGSPVISMGNNVYFNTGQTPDLSAITTDLAGNVRIQKGKIDMGAYESPYEYIPVITPDANGVAYVTTTGAGNLSGNSWGNASDDIQKGINTTGVQQLWVAGGVYKPKYRADNMSDADANDRYNAFVLKKDVKVYGGFAGTETLLTQRDLTLTANVSVLSGDLGVANDNSDNAYHVVISAGDAGTAELNGFAVKDGNLYGSGDITVNLVLINMACGAGIHNSSSSPVLTNVNISGNNAYYGGGIFNFNSSSPVLTNVTISGNNANQGGGIYNYSSSPVLTNVTISGNTASSDGGGIYNNGGSNPKIRNSVIYGNNNGIDNSSSTPVIEYSLVQGLSSVSNGNIDGATDPLFVSPLAPGLNTGGDYRLQDSSPLISKGNDAYFSTGQTPDLSAITTDLDGNLRKLGTIDMGAYENKNASVLPVTVMSFTAKAEGNLAKLEWATATEMNNKEFMVSRSADGVSFTEIGKAAGAGNSSVKKDYTFYDNHPANGINYYRLQQKDFDGRIASHGIRTVQFSLPAGVVIKLYPNPVKDMLKVEFSAGLYGQITLMDHNGKALQRVALSTIEKEKTLLMNDYPSGMYLLHFTGNGRDHVEKIVKE